VSARNTREGSARRVPGHEGTNHIGKKDVNSVTLIRYTTSTVNNAGFRAAWLAVVSVAYQRLELVLLERAFNGTSKACSGPRTSG
jgi:hypothetical protein